MPISPGRLHLRMRGTTSRELCAVAVSIHAFWRQSYHHVAFRERTVLAVVATHIWWRASSAARSWQAGSIVHLIIKLLACRLKLTFAQCKTCYTPDVCVGSRCWWIPSVLVVEIRQLRACATTLRAGFVDARAVPTRAACHQAYALRVRPVVRPPRCWQHVWP